MATGMGVHRHEIQVRCEQDVILIRQDVRQLARTIGMGLAEQAKIAAAIGAVARALLAKNHSPLFVVQTSGEGARSALDVLYVQPIEKGLAEPADLAHDLPLAEMRSLVDEAEISRAANTLVLKLRMLLTHEPQPTKTRCPAP